MDERFIWDDWNENHIAEHDVTREEAAYVVRNRRPPYPRFVGDDKRTVWGQTAASRYLQVIYTIRSADEIDYESLELADIIAFAERDLAMYYVVHARDLTSAERRRFRREAR